MVKMTVKSKTKKAPNWKQYEYEKRKLSGLLLTPLQYQEAIKELARKLNV